MKWFHLIFGILLFIVFTVTGRYMRVDFPDKDAIPQELRLLMRSRHIYILFSALIHLALGVYMQMRPQVWRKVLQFSGSTVLVVSSAFLVWAFVVEIYSLQHFSDLSRNGIYLSLAGIGLHLIGGINRR
ncbi:MAG: hypothetical protein WBD27_15140 [Pyrinomonadaceae bacterium]